MRQRVRAMSAALVLGLLLLGVAFNPAFSTTQTVTLKVGGMV